MTIRQTGVVDWLGTEKGTGQVLLTVIDDLDWGDETGHINTLQEKLNTYLAFIESEEVFERLSEETGKDLPRDTPVKVSILAKYPPSGGASEFLQHVQTVFVSAGIGFSFKVISVQ